MEQGEALPQLVMPKHVSPELEEDGEPAVVALAAHRRRPGHGLDGVPRERRGFEDRVELCHAGVEPALVDREEEVLLRREIRVDGALRVAGLRGDRVERGRVKALGDEQALGPVDERGTGEGLALGAGGDGRVHTVSIQILLVSVKCRCTQA